MSKNKENKKPTVTISTNKKANQVHKDQTSKNKGSALKNISNATLVMNHKKVPSTKKGGTFYKGSKTPSTKDQKAPSTVTNQKEALSTYISTKVQKPLTETQRILATVQIFFSTKINSTFPSKTQKLPSNKTYSSTLTKSQKLISKTQKAHSKVQKLTSTEHDHYSVIVTQVLDSTISEIVETALETYLTIHELQIIGRGHCRTSATDFIKILEHELEYQVKDSLLVSIRPLINKNYNEKTSIINLNTILSEELGLLLNAQQVADNVIKQVYQRVDTLSSVWRSFTNKKWAETVHHERNESLALKAWLCSWLLDIEFTLKDVFDSQISALI
ncbi:hypothetical protein MFLAVUS_010362 [Mucor flavus]|uniref:DUF4378 domain-containing protein n=1 Tax=Mucor flavus TaxID=439312 RepID=A0ABP9ZCH3_9FUNG